MSVTRTAVLAGLVLAIGMSSPAIAQEVEQVATGQRSGVVLLAGVRHQFDDDGKWQLDAGGGHTTDVNSNIGYARLTTRPAAFTSLFLNYVYVQTDADPGPVSKLHILRAGGELTHDIGPFKIANQGELELLGRVGQPDIGRVRDQLRLYYTVPLSGNHLALKLFGSEELIFRLGEGLDRDRITAGARATMDKRVEVSFYYLGDRTHPDLEKRRVGYLVVQLAFIL